VAAGIDALFMEVHEDPDRAKSDGPNSLDLKDFEQVLKSVKEIDAIVREGERR
jgi:2-dehydro-3-deoxyphosphooctonate aldolase (KDO 8-P synthase)